MKTYKINNSVIRAFDILRLLGDQTGPVGGAEIARALDIPKGTAMSDLASLIQSGAVVRINDGYELGEAYARIYYDRYLAKLGANIDRLNTKFRELSI